MNASLAPQSLRLGENVPLLGVFPRGYLLVPRVRVWLDA